MVFAKYTHWLCVKYYSAGMEELSVKSFIHTCLKWIKLGCNFILTCFNEIVNNAFTKLYASQQKRTESARPMRNFARFNGNAKTAVTKITYLYTSNAKSSQDEITCFLIL